MTWEWAIIGVFVVSIIGLAVVLVRKFPITAAIDMKHLPPVETRKAEIVENRLRRKFDNLWGGLASRSRPVTSRLSTAIVATQHKLKDLEHEYKVRSLPVFLGRRERRKVDHEVRELLTQAEVCVTDGEEKIAEEKCLQAIRMEPRSIPAFELLGNLYLKSKEYSHAREVYLYLQKLTGEPDAVYDHRSDNKEPVDAGKIETRRLTYHQNLALAYLSLEELPQAFNEIQEAYRLAPANPKIIDDYLEISITTQKKAFAADALERMREVNPDNKKIADWAERIAAIPETHLSADSINEPDSDTMG